MGFSAEDRKVVMNALNAAGHVVIASAKTKPGATAAVSNKLACLSSTHAPTAEGQEAIIEAQAGRRPGGNGGRSIWVSRRRACSPGPALR